MYHSNNPFKPVPQRPERNDPARDKWRDPIFYEAFVKGRKWSTSPTATPPGIRPPRVSTGPNGNTATRPPSSSSTRLLTRRPATRTSPTSSAQSAPSSQKQPHDTIRLPCSHRPRVRRRLRRTPPPHARDRKSTRLNSSHVAIS